MPSTTPQRRATSRRATTHRNPSRATTPRRPLRRKQPDPSRAQQFLGMLGRATPSKGAATGRKKPMGLAMIGAGAAAAFSQRDRLAGMFGKRKDEMPETAPPPRPVAATEPPVAPPVAPERSGGTDL